MPFFLYLRPQKLTNMKPIDYKRSIIWALLLVFFTSTVCAQSIDLSGTWSFQIDREGKGVADGWYKPDFTLNDQIVLPASMPATERRRHQRRNPMGGFALRFQLFLQSLHEEIPQPRQGYEAAVLPDT